MGGFLSIIYMKNIKLRHFFRKNKKIKIIFAVLKYAVFLFLIACVFLLFLFFYYTYDLPRPEKFAETPFIQSTKIYDRTGKVLLYDIYGEEKRTVAPFDKISNNLKAAVLASEDTRFYQHSGVDFRGIFRSVIANLMSQSIEQGGSTITQQLIRSTYLTRQRTLSRKIRELVLSVEMERRYSKDQIFDWYLNKIPLGSNTYGVEAASQTYFNKPSSDVSLAESAILAALIPAPSYYSPYGEHKDLLLQKSHRILEKMRRDGYINEEQFSAAKQEKLVFSSVLTPMKAPHFVIYVKKYLEEKYGEDFLMEKGLKVYTTLDWDLQDYAEQIVKDADKANAQFGAHNAAAVIINPKTGEILSLIGSKDYFGESYPVGCGEIAAEKCLFNPKFDVAIMGQRQPGSAFKPIVYATAFKGGFYPDTVLWDVKTEFNANCPPDGSQEKDQYGLGCYHPQNYDGLYRGKVTLRSALAQSLNVPSVKLLYLAGLNNSIKTAQDLGIATLNEPDRYGLSLVLGGGEVTLLEITSAYSVFAAEGLKTPPTSILSIEDSGGNVIEKNTKEPTMVLNTEVARKINDILSDNGARSPMFGANSALYFNNYQVAAKTGTTQYFSDAWTIGYTPSAAVGVWVGNNDNSSTNKKTGIGLAAPIWRKIMEKLLSASAAENFTKPSIEQGVNPVLLGIFPDGNSSHELLHYVDKNNPTGPILQNPSPDPLYYHWEEGVKRWLGAPWVF